MLLKIISEHKLTLRTFKTLNQYIDYFHRNNPQNLEPKIIEIGVEDILLKINESELKDQNNLVNFNLNYKIFRIFHKNECFWYTAHIFREFK